MKKLFILIATLSLMTSCGNDIRKTIGADYDNKINKTDTRLYDLENRINELEVKAITTISEIAMIQVKLSELDTSQVSLHESLINYSAALQLQIDSINESVVELQLQESVVEFIDPCGDGTGFDEVLMKTKSGKLIAYFESGSNRFLSILVDGNYRTTDQQACNFSVTGGIYQE